MKKNPSFRRFLFITVLSLQVLSLVMVISFLYASLDNAMEKEYFDKANVQRGELNMYLSNRLSYLKGRVKDISSDNSIRAGLLLEMRPKAHSHLEAFYPPENGAAFFICSPGGEIYPRPTGALQFLKDPARWPIRSEHSRMVNGRPDLLAFSAPIFSNAEFKGHAICIYSLANDPSAYRLIEAFDTLELVEKRDGRLVNIFAAQNRMPADKVSIADMPRRPRKKRQYENSADLIPLEAFPALFLRTSNEPLRAKRRNLTIQLAALCLPLLVLTIGVTSFIIHRMTTAMDALARNAQSIADSEAMADLDEKQIRHAEFLHFTRAFNKVLSRVRAQTISLTEANARLQDEISERTRMAEALQEREVQMRSLQSNIPIGLFRTTYDGKMISINPKFVEILGHETDRRILEQPFELLFDRPEDYHRLKRRIDRENVVEAMEMRLRRKDGSLAWCTLHLKKLHDPSTGHDFLDGAILDITDHKKIETEKQNLELQLRQAQKMEAIGTLAGGIAHDFNNILAAIDGFSELALDDAPEESILHENIKEIRIASQRATDLVKQILTFARQAEVEKRPVKLAIILQESLKLLRSTIPSNIDIRTEIRSQKIISADPTQLHQIVYNLCSNAAHAMRSRSGLLTIRLHETVLRADQADKPADLLPGRYFLLTIQDTGHGMSRETLERIFDPYFTTKEQGEGTGMGLSVVQGIVNGMRGAITVASVPDNGTTFQVYLPVLEKQSRPREESRKALAGGTEHILLVDDETAITHMGRQMLERLGYQVTTSNSSMDALALFQAEPERYDLVLCDMAMPKMTGDHLTREIMGIRRDIPVILCTGYSDQISQEQALALGIHGLLHKPIVKHELAAALRTALDQKLSLPN